jgi:hypothetical protein
MISKGMLLGCLLGNLGPFWYKGQKQFTEIFSTTSIYPCAPPPKNLFLEKSL